MHASLNQPRAYATQIQQTLSQLAFTMLHGFILLPAEAEQCRSHVAYELVLSACWVYFWLLQISTIINAMSWHIAPKNPFAYTIEEFSSRRFGFDQEIALLAAEMYRSTPFLGDQAEACCLLRQSRVACDKRSSTSQA